VSVDDFGLETFCFYIYIFLKIYYIQILTFLYNSLLTLSKNVIRIRVRLRGTTLWRLGDITLWKKNFLKIILTVK
jgi:hypothetical protein